MSAHGARRDQRPPGGRRGCRAPGGAVESSFSPARAATPQGGSHQGLVAAASNDGTSFAHSMTEVGENSRDLSHQRRPHDDHATNHRRRRLPGPHPGRPCRFRTPRRRFRLRSDRGRRPSRSRDRGRDGRRPCRARRLGRRDGRPDRPGPGRLAGLGVLSGIIPVVGPAIAAGTLGVILSNAAAGRASPGSSGPCRRGRAGARGQVLPRRVREGPHHRHRPRRQPLRRGRRHPQPPRGAPGRPSEPETPTPPRIEREPVKSPRSIGLTNSSPFAGAGLFSNDDAPGRTARGVPFGVSLPR